MYLSGFNQVARYLQFTLFSPQWPLFDSGGLFKPFEVYFLFQALWTNSISSFLQILEWPLVHIGVLRDSPWVLSTVTLRRTPFYRRGGVAELTHDHEEEQVKVSVCV